MGMMVTEHQHHHHQQQQYGNGNGGVIMRSPPDDDRRKNRRRSNRRPKQNGPLNGSAAFDLPGQYHHSPQNLQNGDLSRSGSSLMQHGSYRPSNVAFNSLPTFHVSDQVSNYNPGGSVFSQSCPTPDASQNLNGLQNDMGSLYLGDGCNKQKRFDPHWSSDSVKEALQKGEVFEATLRVNAHNRLEAYCSIEGVPTDILISGIPFQNRAVEGDIVAIRVDPPLHWSRMKGSAASASNSSSPDESDPSEGTQINRDSLRGKSKVDTVFGDHLVTNGATISQNGSHNMSSTNGVHYEVTGNVNIHVNGHYNPVADAVEKLCQAVASSPSKRPTGRVVAILEPSPRRNSVVGHLDIQWWLSSRERENGNNMTVPQLSRCDYVQLIPTDPKFPKMIVQVRSLPDDIKKRLGDGDASIQAELVAARIDYWPEESFLPQAFVMRSFGRGADLEPRIDAILFENDICCSEFSPESLSCLPHDMWQVPQTELRIRKDIRNLCVFTIDPSTATDLDDALSVEKLPGGVFRVGVHIADVSYFVQPDTALDIEAQVRSTSVYMMRSKLPMLPPLLSENMGSLNPGVDRLAFSVFWDINLSGVVLDRWVGRTVIRSCCKLSYEQAQDIIDGQIDVDSLKSENIGFPQLHGRFGWHDVFQSVKSLNDISKVLKQNRFNDGALRLDNAKIVFSLDEFGIPYDSRLCDRKDANFLVEEFMLLANRTAAEIISRAFPASALLRRHPEPNLRKLKELEAFCRKHGLELDTSSSGSLNQSLEKIKDKLKDDVVLYDIVINYATKPMQLAKYFCSGDVKVGEDEWGHYALAVPLYTHFTSPLRRYPDIVVHRTLMAAIEAEQTYMECRSRANEFKQIGKVRCFTGLDFDKLASQSVEGQQALSSAAFKHKVPCSEKLSDVASYCNRKKLASRYVKDAIDKLYMWVLLKNKEVLLSEARVLGVGPRFMSIYVQKLAIERRIHYDEVDGLMVEWLEATSTLLLSYVNNNKRSQRRGSPGKYRPLDEVVLLESSCNLEEEEVDNMENGACGLQRQPNTEITPAVFPLTIQVLSTIPVALHAFGGDDGSLDIAARLYVSSYFR